MQLPLCDCCLLFVCPDIKPGCIPGSVNVPFPKLMNLEEQTFKSKEELLKIFNELSVDLSKPIVATCGSGTTMKRLMFDHIDVSLSMRVAVHVNQQIGRKKNSIKEIATIFADEK